MPAEPLLGNAGNDIEHAAAQSALLTLQAATMLPTHGGTYYGGKSRRNGGQTTSQVMLIALLLSSLLLGIGFWRTNLRSSHLAKELKQLRSSHEETDSNHKSYYNKMEHESVLNQRRIQELSRELSYAEAKVRELTTQKDACTAHESQLNSELQEIKEQLNYEKAIVDAHKIKITQLEKAHAAREADWHELSKAWAQFESDATKENTRLLQELNALQSKTGSPTSTLQQPSIPHHNLPNEEPKNRPETNFDFHIDIPKEEDFVHHHAPHAQGAAQAAAGLTHSNPAQTGGVAGSAHDTHVDSQGHAAPDHHGFGDHHSNIYNHHYHDWHDDHHLDHVDPLDHYWTGHDHFNDGHDNFHEGHYHHYADHAADHQHHADSRHLQEHGSQHPNERIHSYHDDWGHYTDHHFDNHFDHWDGHHWEDDHAHHEQHEQPHHQDIHTAQGRHDTQEQHRMHDSQDQQRHTDYKYQGRVH